MSEEQNEVTVEKNCKGTLLITLVTLSLLVSIANLVLSTANMLRVPGFFPQQEAAQPQQEGKKVVISSQYDRGRSLAKARATKKPIVVFFYTDWCGFCQRFAPTFDKITKMRAIRDKFAVAFVNCEKEENHADMQEFNVQGFPTVYVIKPNGEKVQLENGTFFNEDSVRVVSDKMLEIIK